MTKTAVYHHYDAAGALLYIGASACPRCRHSVHRTQSSWGLDVASISIDWHDTREQALAAEAALIKELQPPFNKEWQRKPRGKWKPNNGHLFVADYLRRFDVSLLEFANAIGLSVAAARKYAERVSHPSTKTERAILEATKGYVPMDCWERHKPRPFAPVTASEARSTLREHRARQKWLASRNLSAA